MSLSRVVFSSASDHWATPSAVYDGLHAEFDFTFDPCPLLSTVDGSKIAWHGRVFCNPPYSAIGDFIRRGLSHLANGEVELMAFLIPARTDTAWFHDYALKSEIRFIRGRLKFGNAKNNAPFPSMICIWREWALA